MPIRFISFQKTRKLKVIRCLFLAARFQHLLTILNSETMTRVRVIFFLCVWSLCLFNQCVEPYEPHVNTPPDSYLVVNTFVGNTDAVIELKRSQAVNDEDRPKAETGAQVTIEAEAGVTFSLAEESPGRYVSFGMNMTTTDRCRLRIKTSDGKEYESVYVPVLF